MRDQSEFTYQDLRSAHQAHEVMGLRNSYCFFDRHSCLSITEPTADTATCARIVRTEVVAEDDRVCRGISKRKAIRSGSWRLPLLTSGLLPVQSSAEVWVVRRKDDRSHAATVSCFPGVLEDDA